MTITYQDFTPTPDAAVQFRAILDGNPYNIVVTWNAFGQRWYVNIYTTQGALVYTTPRVESPDGYDISMVNGIFNTTLVFRDSSQKFEINDAPVPNSSSVLILASGAMLDAAGNPFVLDTSLLGIGIPGQMFDANGNPFVLDQSKLASDVMLDSTGATFALDSSQLAASQDLTSQAMIDNTGAPLTLDKSQI